MVFIYLFNSLNLKSWKFIVLMEEMAINAKYLLHVMFLTLGKWKSFINLLMYPTYQEDVLMEISTLIFPFSNFITTI